MRQRRLLTVCVLLVTAVSSGRTAAQGRVLPARVTLFEGARLITGDDRQPIERSAFLVEGNRFVRVGRQGEVQAPAGAARVDLTGKTEISADNMRQAAFPATTEAGVRAAVRELARRKVTIVKTWVDDRGGTIEPMRPELYKAIIDEAHKNHLRVAVHATGLQDAKNLLRADVDIFAHMIADVDDELVELFKQHPETVVLSALGGPHRTVYAPWLNPVHPLIAETVRPDQIARLQSHFPLTAPAPRARAQEAWDRLARAAARLSASGVTIGVGTDGGGQQGDQFIGWTLHAELENLVMAGIPPARVLVAATRTSAEILGLTDLGLVAAGKSADFVVLDANPLDDITNTRRISRVFLRGVEIDRARLRAGFMAH